MPNNKGSVILYSKELADKICARLEEGIALRALCREPNMPSASSVFMWLEREEYFAKQYAKSRMIGYDMRAEAALEAAQNAKDAQKGRLAFDAERWYLGKMAPKKYGERVTNELVGKDGGPVQLGVIMVPSKNEIPGV